MDFGLRIKGITRYLLDQGVGHSYSYVVHHKSPEHPLSQYYFQLFSVKEITFLELVYVPNNFIDINKKWKKNIY